MNDKFMARSRMSEVFIGVGITAMALILLLDQTTLRDVILAELFVAIVSLYYSLAYYSKINSNPSPYYWSATISYMTGYSLILASLGLILYYAIGWIASALFGIIIIHEGLNYISSSKGKRKTFQYAYVLCIFLIGSYGVMLVV